MREQQRQSDRGHTSVHNLSGLGAAEIQHYLHDIDYPADKSQLLDQARSQNAPQDVLDMIEEFPEMQYNSAVHVSQMLDRLHH